MKSDTLHLVAKGLVAIALVGLLATAVLLGLGVSADAVALISSSVGIALGALASPLSRTDTEPERPPATPEGDEA